MKGNLKKVYTESDFRKYLSGKFYDMVVLMESFETHEPIFIKRPVRLFCRTDVYIYYLNYYGAPARYEAAREPGAEHSAIRVQSAGVRISNFGLMGGDRVLTDSPQVDGIQSGIMLDCPYANVIIEDSAILGFNWGSIWHFDCAISYILNNNLIGAGNEYYNYAGAWLGGKGNASGQKMHFIGNSSNQGRHVIGASGHPNSYYALGNYVEGTIKHAFDRHAYNTPGVGGLDSHIIGNTFKHPDRFAFSLEKPYQGGTLLFNGNRLARADSRPVGEVDEVAITDYGVPTYHEMSGLQLANNTYNLIL